MFENLYCGDLINGDSLLIFKSTIEIRVIIKYHLPYHKLADVYGLVSLRVFPSQVPHTTSSLLNGCRNGWMSLLLQNP